MFDWLEEVERIVGANASDVDPAVLSSAAAADIVVRVAALEKRLAAVRLSCSLRAAEGGWAGSYRSAPAWLAAQTGTTAGEAAESLRLAEQLTEAPEVVAQAVAEGRLSERQAAAVVGAALADPGAAGSLLSEAESGADLRSLRRRCRQVEAAARPDEEMAAQARHHSQRYLRTWTDRDGGFCGSFKMTALAGARLRSCLDVFHSDLFDKARSDGRRERPDALEADALVALAEAALAGGGRPGVVSRPTIVVRVDLAALERGWTAPGEESSIDGIGPIPVPAVRSLWSEAVLAALAVDGHGRIADLRLAGRAMPRRMRLAVIARDRCCVVPGCGAERHLEIHHLTAVEHGGPTELANLALLCRWHHDQITHRNATLTGGPGTWRYRPSLDEQGGPFDDGLTDIRPPPLLSA